MPTTNDVRNALAVRRTAPRLFGETNAASASHPFFHWPLEFLDVFERGGFDVVLGNPPWDRYRLAEREFLAGREPEIAAASRAADRKRMIAALADADPALHVQYKFCLLTITGQERLVDKAEFVFFLHRTEQLDDPGRRFTLASEDFALFNPNTRNCPVFRTQRDAELSRAIYEHVPVFVDERQAGKAYQPPPQWRISFFTIFHISSDPGYFVAGVGASASDRESST